MKGEGLDKEEIKALFRKPSPMEFTEEEYADYIRKTGGPTGTEVFSDEEVEQLIKAVNAEIGDERYCNGRNCKAVDESKIRLKSDDGCVYVYDIDTKTMKKECHVTDIADIPSSVLDTIKKLRLELRIKEQKMLDESLTKEEIDVMLDKKPSVIERIENGRTTRLTEEEYAEYIKKSGGGGTEILSEKEVNELLDAINGNDGQTNDHLAGDFICSDGKPCDRERKCKEWDIHMLDTLRWKLRSALRIVEDLLK